MWVDDNRGVLATSAYYPQKAHKWLNAYNAVYSQRASDDRTKNLAVAHAAQACVVEQAMGRDAVTDYLAVTLSAKGRGAANWQTDMEGVYIKLDQLLCAALWPAEKRDTIRWREALRSVTKGIS